VHHAVPAHHGQHVHARRHGLPGHRLCLGEVTAEQDLRLQTGVAELSRDMGQQLQGPTAP
jgi:hypothetical protein